MEERTFLLRARIEDGEWLYRSNWPADSEMPLTLLDIRYVDSKDEARALGASEFVVTEQLSSDDPTCWCWAVLTAAEDDVRYTVDRESLDSFMEEIGKLILPVSFYIHLEAKQQVSFSELDLQITAYKTTSSGSAACVTELFYDMPTIINGSSNNTLSEYSLVRGYSSSTTHVNTPYHYGEYTFTNNSDQETDVYLPGTYYFAMIVRWASSYDHLGHGLVGFENKYCTDNRKLNDRDIQIVGVNILLVEE